MLKEAEGICPGLCSPEEGYDREYRTYARAKRCHSRPGSSLAGHSEHPISIFGRKEVPDLDRKCTGTEEVEAISATPGTS